MRIIKRIALALLVLFAIALSSLAVLISYDSACPVISDAEPGADTITAVTYRCYGASDVLQVESIEKPTPADNEVLVKVHAAGVNPLDWHYMRGSPYIMRLASGIGAPETIRLGVDFSGTVEAVGAKVTRFSPGDEVFGGATGAFAEYVTIADHRAIAHKPDNISFEQAGTVAIAAITALQALRDEGHLAEGQKVLINGASGGVGTFAVQIAKSFGAEVTGVCSTRNVDMVRGIGADHVIDYKRESFVEGEERYDLIVDMVSNHGLSDLLDVLEPGGRLVIVGGGKGNWVGPAVNPLKTMLMAPFVDHELATLMAILEPADLNALAEMMASGHVTPVIDRRFRLDEAAEAMNYSESGRARGKIVINVI